MSETGIVREGKGIDEMRRYGGASTNMNMAECFSILANTELPSIDSGTESRSPIHPAMSPLGDTTLFRKSWEPFMRIYPTAFND